MLGWATTRCPTARFLLKADDDMFLNLPALVRHLQQLAGPPAAYLGYVYSRVAPIHNPHSRHYVPTLLYPNPPSLLQRQRSLCPSRCRCPGSCPSAAAAARGGCVCGAVHPPCWHCPAPPEPYGRGYPLPA
ncbi:hypothetical protein E2320_022625 [Naja naja]|nr:hypothetical protein E2320_022625 [Naja naja]